jgi:hypothetical protein
VDSVVTGLVFVVSVVVVLVCAKANGAIAAQARMSMLFFMMFPSNVVVPCGLDLVLNQKRGRG